MIYDVDILSEIEESLEKILKDELLKIQGSVLDRDTIGYIAGAQVNYYDEQGNEIENIFLLNRKLQK